MINVIGSDHYENMQKTENCLINDLKLFADQQIATHWFEMQEIGELKNYTEAFNLDMVQPSSPRYSSMSPLYSHDKEDPSQRDDEERGIREYLNTFMEINSTQET